MSDNEKLNERVRHAEKTIKQSYGLAYARKLYKASAQGFYLNKRMVRVVDKQEGE